MACVFSTVRFHHKNLHWLSRLLWLIGKWQTADKDPINTCSSWLNGLLHWISPAEQVTQKAPASLRSSYMLVHPTHMHTPLHAHLLTYYTKHAFTQTNTIARVQTHTHTWIHTCSMQEDTYTQTYTHAHTQKYTLANICTHRTLERTWDWRYDEMKSSAVLNSRH